MSSALCFALWMLAGAAIPVLATMAGIGQRVFAIIVVAAVGFLIGYCAQAPMSLDFYGPFAAMTLGAIVAALMCAFEPDGHAGAGIRRAIMFAPFVILF